MQNEAQYDWDRKAAEISILSSKNVDKYEYLTGEDLGLKPSAVEREKFEYSPLSKIFNKGLEKDDKKEGIFKTLENIKDKREELLNTFSATNKDSKAAKMRAIIIMNLNTLFTNFRETLKNLKECH